MGKRQASSAAVSGAAKVPKGPPTDLELLSKILEDFEEYKSIAAELLLKALPRTAGVERFDEQDESCGRIREALQTAREKCISSQATLQSEITAAKIVVESSQAKVKEAEEVTVQFEQDLAAKAEHLNSQKQERADALKEHNKVERVANSFTNQIESLRQAISKLSATITGPLSDLLEGPVSQDGVQRVVEMLLLCAAEKALVAASSGALLTAPSARGDFDKVTIELIQKLLNCKLHELEQELAEQVPQQEATGHELIGLWALGDILQEKIVAFEQTMEQAKANIADLKTAAVNATKEVTEQEKELSNILVKQTLEEMKVQDIDVAAAAFERLVAAEAAAVAAAEAAAAEAAAASEAAAAVSEAVEQDVETHDAAAAAADVVDEKVAESVFAKSPAGSPVSHGNALNVPTPMVG